MNELKTLLEQLKNMDNERDRLTYTNKTHDVSDLFQTIGKFVDEQLTEAIDAVNAAIEKIEAQGELIESIREIVANTPELEDETPIERLDESLTNIIGLIEESE